MQAACTLLEGSLFAGRGLLNSSSYEDYTERHRRRNKVSNCLRKSYFYSLHLWRMQGFSFGSAPARKLPYRAPGAIRFRLFSTRRMWSILLLSAVLPVQRPMQPTKRPCHQSRRSIRSILRLHRMCHDCCHPSKLVQVNPFVGIMRRTDWCARETPMCFWTFAQITRWTIDRGSIRPPRSRWTLALLGCLSRARCAQPTAENLCSVR